ncbi:hypothetical protein AB3N59_15965 [Leptospira sp. WS92.C1]
MSIAECSGTGFSNAGALNLLQFYPSDANSQFLESKISANDDMTPYVNLQSAAMRLRRKVK